MGSLAHVVGEAWTGPNRCPWSRKSRGVLGCAGLREASQLDKTMGSMPPFPRGKDSFRFLSLCGVYNLQQWHYISLVTIFLTFGRDIEKVKNDVAGGHGCHTDCSHQYIQTTFNSNFRVNVTQHHQIKLPL